MKSGNLLKNLYVPVAVVLFSFGIGSTALSMEYHNNCDQCHILHSAAGSHLTYEVNSETMCMSCHDGSTISAPEVTTHEEDDELFASCVDCHNTHSNRDNYEGGTNISLVGYLEPGGDGLAKIMNNYDDPDVYYDVAFDSSREFWRTIRDNGDGGRRVCQVCHVVPTFGMHPNNTDCAASCHTHLRGFRKPGSGGGGGMS